MSISFRERKAASLAAMTADQRAEYDDALDEERERLRLAEVVYEARLAAGLTQTALAEKARTKQSVISAIETGAQVPTFVTLRRIAKATHGALNVQIIVGVEGAQKSTTEGNTVQKSTTKGSTITKMAKARAASKTPTT